MPRRNWRLVAAATVVAAAAGADRARAAAPPDTLPDVVAPPTTLPGPLTPPAPPPGAKPAAPFALPSPVSASPPAGGSDGEFPLKDLTPPGFATDHAEGGHAGAGHGHDAHGEHRTPGHLTPSAPEESGPFVSAELLLMRPRRGAFDFAIPSTAASLATTGPIRSLNYEFRAGLRAEFGYRLGQSGWDVAGGYTYFRTSAFDAINAAPGQVVLPTLTRPGLTDNATFAGADANLELNLYDLTLGRRYALDDSVTVRAFGGVRFANIRQSFNAFYDGLDARAAVVATRSNFQGFGPIAGGEAVFAGWRGFHLYGKASGGLLTGASTNPVRETNNGGRTVYVDSVYDVRKVVPMASVGVGVGWQYRTVSVRAGYEITHFFDLIDQPRFADDVGQGKFIARSANLSLEGLFLQVGMAF